MCSGTNQSRWPPSSHFEQRNLTSNTQVLRGVSLLKRLKAGGADLSPAIAILQSGDTLPLCLLCRPSRMRFGGKCAMLSQSRQETDSPNSIISRVPGAPMFRLLSVICSTSLKQAANFGVAAASALTQVDAAHQARRGAPRPAVTTIH
jgi:hypothetical protein